MTRVYNPDTHRRQGILLPGLLREVTMIRTFARSSTALSLLLLAGSAAAQESVTLRGVVVDETTGEPIVGAYVAVRESNQGVATGATGGFLLGGVRRGSIIEIRQLGYATWIQQADSSATVRVELTVNPIVMDRLEVVSDRLAERWRASAVASRRYTADQIMAAPVMNARDFAYMRASFGPCPDGRADCVWRRGGWVAPSIYIDDIPYCSDMNALLGLPTHEIHLFEMIGGTTFYVYTKQFAERLALGQVRVMPLQLVSRLAC